MGRLDNPVFARQFAFLGKSENGWPTTWACGPHDAKRGLQDPRDMDSDNDHVVDAYDPFNDHSEWLDGS